MSASGVQSLAQIRWIAMVIGKPRGILANDTFSGLMGDAEAGNAMTGSALMRRADGAFAHPRSFGKARLNGSSQTMREGPAVARQLVDDGVQLLELCGGFGPVWTARIIDALGARLPAGSVGYGPEAIQPMHDLFKAWSRARTQRPRDRRLALAGTSRSKTHADIYRSVSFSSMRRLRA